MHIHNTNKKVASRNNHTKKLSNSKWGCNASTIRTTALALSYSAAEYANPVWSRSPHASKLDPKLNDPCRSITGCLMPTNVEELYLLVWIAPPDIRRDVCARAEKKKQETNAAHSLHGQVPAERPADFPAKVIRYSEWQHRKNLAPHNCAVNLDESLAEGIAVPGQRGDVSTGYKNERFVLLLVPNIMHILTHFTKHSTY